MAKDDEPQGSYSQGRWVPPDFEWRAHTAEQNRLIRARQRSRAIVTAALLGAFVVLVFAISFVKMRSGG